MIGEDSIVQILDIENSTPYEDTVSSIFNKFIEKGTKSANVIYYKPKEGSLKIRDLQGWTDILQMSMFYNTDSYTMANCGVLKVFDSKIKAIKYIKETWPEAEYIAETPKHWRFALNGDYPMEVLYYIEEKEIE